MLLEGLLTDTTSLENYLAVSTNTKSYDQQQQQQKVMTNLDSILKSRDITFPTRVYIVNAIVFPLVMYGCKSWTIKKAENQRIDVFELWCWRRLLIVS